LTATWTFTDQCGTTITHTQTVTVEPIEPPSFTNPPGDETLNCAEFPNFTFTDLSYANTGTGACAVMGSVSPTVTGDADICGGELVGTWEFTDQCGTTITHTQTITVEPIDPPAFVDPPADQVLSCEEFETFSTSTALAYSNGSSICPVDGTVLPTINGALPTDKCGGSFSLVWTYTDQCGTTITHTQNITIEPIAAPEFVNPPADETIGCAVFPTYTAPSLQYSNNSTGMCLTQGSADPVQSGPGATICGGQFIFTWTATDECNQTVEHVQTVTVTSVDPATFINLPADITVSCSEFASVTNNTLEYSNFGVGPCLETGFADPVQIGAPDPICGGEVRYQWSYTDQCGEVITASQIVTVLPAPEASYIDPPIITEPINCQEAEQLTSIPLQYSNGSICEISGTVDPVVNLNYNACGGTADIIWTAVDPCQRRLDYVQSLQVRPAPAPVFTSALPQDVTVSCQDLSTFEISLNYSNGLTGNCGINGTVQGEVQEPFNPCGGTYNVIWRVTDDCGTVLEHIQRVTLTSTPVQWVNLPPSIVQASCASGVPAPPQLLYSNGQSGICAIEGEAIPVQVGDIGACGGQIEYVYNYSDGCGNNLSFTQIVRIDPAPLPVIQGVPGNLVLPCGGTLPDGQELFYTNNNQNQCLVEGFLTPQLTQVNENTYVYTWTYDDPCSNDVVTATQTITLPPQVDISVNPNFVEICSNDGIDLSNITVTEAQGNNFNISYHTALPPTGSNQVTPNQFPLEFTTYYIYGFNSFGCNDVEQVDVLVFPSADAGIGQNGSVCRNQTFNLFNFLTNGFNNTGEWFQLSGPSVNISDPTNVSIASLGTYSFTYIDYGFGGCPDDQSYVDITVVAGPNINVVNVACTPSGTAYNVTVQNNGFSLSASVGTFTNNGNGTSTVSNIPFGLPVTITSVNNQGCSTSITVQSPIDCNCPDVEDVESTGDETICFGETVPTLSVTAGFEETGLWFTEETGGLPINTGLTYTPTITEPGVYTFYVQGVSEVSPNCLSPQRIPVTLTVLNGPIANDAFLEICDVNQNGIGVFTLTEAISQIIATPSVTIRFYETLGDAQAGINELTGPYTNTTPFNQNIVAAVTGSQGCITYVTVTLGFENLPVVTLSSTRPTCNGADDGTIVISGDPGLTHSLDLGPSISTSSFTGLVAGTYTITSTDPSTGCQATNTILIEPGKVLDIRIISTICDDNGTGLDATDDNYTISFEVTENTGAGGSYTIIVGVTTFGPFQYGETNSIVLPANGGTVLLIAADQTTPACTDFSTLIDLTPCSTDCQIIVSDLVETCSDNGTPTDPSDDSYEISFFVTATNPGASGQFTVTLNGNPIGTYDYNTSVNLTTPANGLVNQLVFVDADIALCQLTVPTSPLISCSDQCLITIANFTRTCSDNNTNTDASDDEITITFTVNKTNGPSNSNSYNVFLNGVLAGGPFAYGVPQSITVPADGISYTFEAIDVDDASCVANRNAGIFNSCSTDCLLTGNINFECSDAGTPSDPSDDQIVMNFTVSGVNNSSSYNVYFDGNLIGNYPYGTAQTLNFQADGLTHTILVEDAEDAVCTITILSNPFETCSNLCDIDALVTNIQCNDAGTEEDDTDDFFTFDLAVSGANTGTAWTSNIGAISGTYGAARSFGPFLISAGNLNLTIADNEDPNCTANVLIQAPPVCSQACDVTVTGLVIGTCDNNGTGNTTADDTFTISFTASAEIPEATNFRVLVNGVPTGTTYSYGTLVTIPGLPANGSQIVIRIEDEDFDICINSFTVSQNPCSSCNQTVDAGVGGQITCTVQTISLTAIASEPATSFSWVGPSGNVVGTTATINATQAGVYTVTARFADGCETTDQVTVTISDDVPVVVVGQTQTITCNVETVTLSGVGSSTGPNIRYEWRNESGVLISTELTTTVSQPGVYILTVFNTSTGCVTAPVSQSVNDGRNNPSAAIFADPGNILNCVVETITLSTAEEMDVNYIWQQSDFQIQGFFFAVNEEGRIQLTAIDTVTGCQSISFIDITDLEEFPIINLQSTGIISCTNTSVNVTSAGSQTGPNISYTWLNSNQEVIATGTPTLSVSTPGIYFLQLEDENTGCTNTEEISIGENLETATITAVSDLELPCDRTTASLSATISNQGPTSITWTAVGGSVTSGGTTATPTINGAGTYIVTVINLANGCATTDTAIVTLVNAPSIGEVTSRDENCFGERNGQIVIEDLAGGTPPFRYSINGTPSPTGTFNNLAAGSYNILVTDSQNCTAAATVTIAPGTQVEILLNPQVEVTFGQSATLEASVNIPEEDLALIQWSPETFLSCPTCLITEVTPIGDQIYRIRVQTEDGCTGEATVRVLVDRNVKVIIPNVINPTNGTGPNRFFTAYGNESVDRINKMHIFDRWGNLVYSRENFAINDPTLGWDGRFNGQDVVPGVFVYLIELSILNGQDTEVYTGDVTVLK